MVGTALVELGAIVTAVSTARGALYASDGLDVERLLDLRAEAGDDLVRRYDGAETIEPGSEIELPVDVLIPASRQEVIDERVAENRKAKVVVEGANLPTTPAAKKVLRSRGVVVVPDFVANPWAVISTGVAMDARSSAIRPDTRSIYALVSEKLRANTQIVLTTAAETDETSHQAALDIARERVRTAMELEGRIPEHSAAGDSEQTRATAPI